MHWQYWPLQVQVPARTPASAPVAATFPIPQGHLKQLEIQVPAGHHGQTGIRVLYQGVQVYPWSITRSWLIEDGRLRTVEWGDEIMATGVSVQAYNTDLIAHSFYLLAEVWPVVTEAQAAVESTGNRARRTATVRAIGRLRDERRAG